MARKLKVVKEAHELSPEQVADEELIKIAKERFKRSQDKLSDPHNKFNEDVLFYDGVGQWPAESLVDRGNRPTQVVNRQKSFVRKICNDALQNPIACKVSAADNNADPDTAEVFTGLIRHIEQNSHAEMAYSNAFLYSVIGGLGFFRVTTDYVTPRSFNQDIFIKPIYNSTSVFFDADGKSQDGSDWKWCFIATDMKREDFEREYPDKDDANFETNSIRDDDDWSDKETVRLAEYFYIDYTKDTVLLLEDGTELLKSDYDDIPEHLHSAMPAISDERETQIPMVKWCLLGGHRILDKKDFPGQYIPVFPIFGDMVETKGKIIYTGIVRPNQDSQRMLNYYASMEAELAALAPKVPFVIAEGQVEGYEDEWADANNVPRSHLTYKPTSIAGVPVPPPRREQFSPPPTGIMAGAANATQRMMDISGIHEANLGEKSNETSGAAINARASQGDNSTFNFIHAKQVTIQHCARVLVDIAPKVIDTKRVIRILGEDGSEKMVSVNDPNHTEKDDFGNTIERFYDLDAGIYDVVVSAGASYGSRRQEAADKMALLLQTSPQLMQTHGDLVAKAMDWPGAQSFAKRSEKLLPPQLQDHKDGDPPKLPPEVQQKLQASDQQIQQLDHVIQQMSAELDDKKAKSETDQARIAIDEANVKIAEFNAHTNRMKVEADIANKKSDTASTNIDSAKELQDTYNANQVELTKHAMNLENDRKKEAMRLSMENNDGMTTIDHQCQQQPSELSIAIQAIMAQQAIIAEQIMTLSTIAAAPKKVTYDEHGKPNGIVSVLQ